MPAGLQVFLTESLDDEDDDESRNGYPSKHWFWGAYQMGDEGFLSEALDGAPAGRRAMANGDPEQPRRLLPPARLFPSRGSRRLDHRRAPRLVSGRMASRSDGRRVRWALGSTVRVKLFRSG